MDGSQIYLRPKLEIFIFYKDLHSVFIGCNEAFSKLAGFQNCTEIRGKTDFEMPWRDSHATLYQEGDRAVLDNVPMSHVLEPQKQKDGKTISILINKIPFINSEGQKTGIIGSFYKQQPFEKTPPNFGNDISITEKQLECLLLLAKGFSTKAIANAMKIGCRTVETHINKLKEKLHCFNTQEMIRKAWESSDIRELLTLY